MPPKKQPQIKAWLRKIMNADTRADAERKRIECVAEQRTLFPKAMAALERDWDRMMTYYELPREHWNHLRTTNVIG